MNKIKYEDIVESVDEHSCPGMFMCTIATTCYEEKKRKARCTRCWLDTMKERNIEVIKGKTGKDSAKRLFKELGYKQKTGIEYNDVIMYYTKENVEPDIILFDLPSRCFRFHLDCDGTNKKLFEAIYKQCEELGWLEE